MSGRSCLRGVYLLYCHANDKAYIGASTNIQQRMKHHCTALKHGKHGNRELQKAFHEFGAELFTLALTKQIRMGFTAPKPESTTKEILIFRP